MRRSIRNVLLALGRHARAVYVERATMTGQRIAPLGLVEPDHVPYFALVRVVGERCCASATMAGKEKAE